MVLPTWTMRLASHAHDLDENAHDTKGGWHQPVRVATTADITIATALNSGDTIDGVTLATGDRVLVKDQTADEQNGIYIAGATPARSEDGDASEEILGSLVYVIEGTANGGKVFRNTNTSAIVIDTDTISFDELAAGSSIAALDDIPDVNAPSPSDGDVLTWDSTPGEWVAAAPTGGSGITVEDEGSPLSTDATTIDFVGAGVTASGTGSTKTITIPGSGSSSGGAFAAAVDRWHIYPFTSTNSASVTITAASSGQRIILGIATRGNDVTSVSCTNVTWTEVLADNQSTNPYLSVYVGVVSGGGR